MQHTETTPPDVGSIDFGLLDCLDVPAVAVEGRGRIVAANEAAAAVTGMDRQRLRGRPFSDLLESERRAAWRAGFTRTCEHDETLEYETVFRDSGERIRARVLLTPLRVGAEVAGVLVLAYDLGWGEPEERTVQPTLTPRQYEVLQLLARGLSTPAIAAHLDIARETVRNHIRAVLAALGAHSRVEAVAKGRRLGLVD